MLKTSSITGVKPRMARSEGGVDVEAAVVNQLVKMLASAMK